MTKKEISMYFWLREEIKRQKRRKEKLIARARRSEYVGDTVRDYSRNAKGTIKIIQGERDEAYKYSAAIEKLEASITANIAKSEEALLKIELYIQTVENPRMRELLRARFIDCMGWDEIGRKFYIAPDYARRLIREFFEKNQS